MTEPLGERLRVKRVIAGLSRLKLAKRAGLSECTIKLIEKGKTRPTESTLLRLLTTKELGLLLTDLPEPDLRRMRKYFRKKERDSVEPHLHACADREESTSKQRQTGLQSPKGDRHEPKDRQHCEAGEAEWETAASLAVQGGGVRRYCGEEIRAARARSARRGLHIRQCRPPAWGRCSRRCFHRR